MSVYFDSDELLLRDHGLTLRVRHIGDKRVQTIKSADHGIFERSEWEQPIESDQPNLALAADTPLGPLLTDDIRNALKPLFETRISRTSYRLNGGDTDIAMAFDEGRIVAAGSSCAVSEIELELKRGKPAELFDLARTIGDIVPAQLDVRSKSERGFDLVEIASIAAGKAYEPELSGGTSAGRAFTLIARACLRQLLTNESAAKKRNAEALHQMRIALRRLRAAISLFSAVVTDPRVEAIKTELKWLGGSWARLAIWTVSDRGTAASPQAASQRAGAHQHQQDVRAGTAQELSAGAGGGRVRPAFAPSFSTAPNGLRPVPGAPRTIR